jgi:hypothetical protein
LFWRHDAKSTPALPERSACVGVVPPLSWSGPNAGSAAVKGPEIVQCAVPAGPTMLQIDDVIAPEQSPSTSSCQFAS